MQPVEFASFTSSHEDLEKQAIFGEKCTCPLLTQFLNLLLMDKEWFDIIFLFLSDLPATPWRAQLDDNNQKALGRFLKLRRVRPLEATDLVNLCATFFCQAVFFSWPEIAQKWMFS